MKKLFFLFILMLSPLLASAEIVEINDIWYNLNVETKTAEVTRNPSYSSTTNNSTTKYVAIPSQVNYNEVSYQVTAIGEDAFRHYIRLWYIGIPSSVTSIGSNAFGDCGWLEKVNIEDITAWCKIQFANAAANPLWNAHHLYLNGVEVTHVTIPNTITSIQPWVFCGYTYLTSVTIPTSVTKIGQYAFYNSGLTSVEIPSSVTMIGESAFEYCQKMTSVNIPNTLTSIEPSTFSGCSSLTSISIPSSVKSIGRNAFFGCQKMEAVHIKDLSVWCKTQFVSYYSNPLANAGHLYVDGREIKNLVIPSDVTEISDYAFYGFYDLTSVTFPSHVTKIGISSFGRCYGLTGIVIPNSMTTIGASAFESCTGLTSLIIPSNVIDIQVGAFMDCENLKTVVIEEGVKNIGGGAFWRCSALTSIVIPNSVTTLGESSFWGCAAMNSVNIGNGIKEIPRNAFGNCTSLKKLYCYAEDVPTVDIEGFAKTDIQKIILYVPTVADVSAYQAVEPWKNFKEIVAMTALDDYRPFVEDGKVWKVGTITGNPVQVVDHYYFEGDTIINGKTYKQMMCQRYINPAYPYYDDYAYPNSLRKVGAWYEENKKVYFYDEEQQSMMLKYDFSLGANDTLQFLNVDGYLPYIIGPKQIGGLAGFKGVYRDIMMCVNASQNIKRTTWLEGVGSIDGPTRSPCNPILDDPVPEFLMSCTIGEEVIFLNDQCEDGATPEDLGAKKHRFDFTHTIKTKPTAPIRRGAEAQSLYGEYNERQLGINLDPLVDTYQVSITDESDKVVYQKAINAGNIVGLNIDISTYPKGRYVVVVENNHETFTGEFETQTSGVKEIINKKEEKHAIYNLQGQRISSLQKGLNIVNGKKVFVK